MPKQYTDKDLFRIQLVAVAIGILLLGAKFTAYFLTHSNTILTDALESIINVVAGMFALYSLYISAKPKDADHPYGHGKVEFLSAGFEGVLIIIAGVVIISKSVVGFFHPRALEHLDWGLVLVVVSGLINYFLGFFLQRAGKQHGSLTLQADGEHLKSDAYSSAGILIGLVIIYFTGWVWLDNVVAIIFGFVIIYTGIKLSRKSVAGIMDEADEEAIKGIAAVLEDNRQTEWIDVHNLRIIQYGSKLHVDCHVTLPWYYTLEEAHRQVDKIEEVVEGKHSSQTEFFIHTDPCISAQCKICQIADCPVRQHAFTHKMDWTIETVLQNKRHGL